MGVVGDGAHHQDRHHDARNDAREKQLADRHVGHHSVDDERQRGRNDWTECRGRRRHADGEADVVSLVAHRLDLDRAEARRVGDRSARHAGEDYRADDVDVAETALQPTDQCEREIVDAVGDAGVVHQIAGENEERHGEERKAVDAADHAMHDDERRHVAGQQDVDESRSRHGDGHGHARRHHGQKARQ